MLHLALCTIIRLAHFHNFLISDNGLYNFGIRVDGSVILIDAGSRGFADKPLSKKEFSSLAAKTFLRKAGWFVQPTIDQDLRDVLSSTDLHSLPDVLSRFDLMFSKETHSKLQAVLQGTRVVDKDRSLKPSSVDQAMFTTPVSYVAQPAATGKSHRLRPYMACRDWP